MTVIVYVKRPFKKVKFEGVHSLIENKENYGIGLFGKSPIFYPKAALRKVKVICDGTKR